MIAVLIGVILILIAILVFAHLENDSIASLIGGAGVGMILLN